jgi:tetratricopeptide (TPR) repeat protein
MFADNAEMTEVPPGEMEKASLLLPWRRWEAGLQELERRLLSDPGAVGLRFQRALLLSQLGRSNEARDEYLKVLEYEPHHVGALNQLGRVLFAIGQRREAQTAIRKAVVWHPNDPLSRVNLGVLLLQESELLEASQRDEEARQLKHEARKHYEQALRLRKGYRLAHEGLSYLLGDLGDQPKAAWHRGEAFRNRYLTQLPYRGRGAPVPVLLLLATTNGNAPLQNFLDDRIFQMSVARPEFYDPKTPLPLHQLVVNAIGDAEVASQALLAAQSVLALTTAPLINPPAAVLATGRSNNAKRLSGLPGVVTPTTAMLTRAQLADSHAPAMLAACGLEFPLLMRVPGFHTGMKFLRVESSAELPAALEKLPGQELIVMQYLNAGGPEGKARKYRAMMIDGQIYPLHLAISSHWKVHYFSAEMAANPEYRAEEAAFLENMPAVLGPVAMNALQRIQSVLGLDYGGIDFGLSAKGEVLIFEANATMRVNPPEAGAKWQYRLPAYKRIEAAVQKMLMERVRRDFSPGREGAVTFSECREQKCLRR